jgi:hypothetical protein
VNPRFRLTERTVGDTELRSATETVSGEPTAISRPGFIGFFEALASIHG